MGSSGPECRIRPGQVLRNRLGRWSVVASVAVVGLLAIPMGPAGATSPGHTFTIAFHAPYTNLTPQTGHSLGISGCHTNASLPIAPRGFPGTGRVIAVASERGLACAGAPAYQFAGANLGFSGPNFRVPHNCTCAVSFEWNLTFQATLTATPAFGVSAAYASTQVQFELVDFVLAIQNQTGVGFADAFPFSVIEFNGTTQYNGTSEPFWANTTADLSAHTLYQLQSNLYIYVNSYETQGGSASGIFDLGFHGRQGFLAAVTVVG